MATRKSMVRFLPWVQMLLSFLLAGSIVWGYTVFRAPIAAALEALSNSIISVSNVIEVAAGTVDSRKELIDSTRQTLAQARAAIAIASKAIGGQTSQAAKRADELRAASSLTFRTSETLNGLADGLIDFTAPMGIEFEGSKPLIVMKRPLAASGKNLKPIASEIRSISDGFLHLSKTVATDGVQMGSAFTQLSEQTIRMLEESQRTLERVQNNDLPRSAKEMRDTAKQLKTVIKEVTSVSDGIGVAALVFGLLFSAWLFLNSISMIVLANRDSGE